MADSEDYSGLITARVEKIAREVVKEEIPNCRAGIEHETKIKDIERRITDMDCNFLEGLKELKNTITEQNKRKENHIWDIVQQVMTFAVLLFVAYLSTKIK